MAAPNATATKSQVRVPLICRSGVGNTRWPWAPRSPIKIMDAIRINAQIAQATMSGITEPVRMTTNIAITHKTDEATILKIRNPDAPDCDFTESTCGRPIANFVTQKKTKTTIPSDLASQVARLLFRKKENIATRAMPTSTMVFNTHGDDCSVSEDPQVRHLCHGEIKS